MINTLRIGNSNLQQMVCLTSEEDSKWKKMRYMPITKVLEHFEQEHKRDLK